jgi:hypothetical protein
VGVLTDLHDKKVVRVSFITFRAPLQLGKFPVMDVAQKTGQPLVMRMVIQRYVENTILKMM